MKYALPFSADEAWSSEKAAERRQGHTEAFQSCKLNLR